MPLALLQGIQFLIENDLLKNTCEDIAQFLYKGEGLNKTAIGDYLGERYARPGAARSCAGGDGATLAGCCWVGSRVPSRTSDSGPLLSVRVCVWALGGAAVHKPGCRMAHSHKFPTLRGAESRERGWGPHSSHRIS